MPFDVRTIAEDEVGSWADTLGIGFHEPNQDPSGDFRRRAIELDRTWAAFDGARPVGTLRSFPVDTALPGSTLVTSAITAVATIPTHRRRGVASAMMGAELAASKERGEPAAILIAAEYPIYGRFGFGPAAWSVDWTVDARGTLPSSWAPPGSVEFVDAAMGREVAPGLQDQAFRRRPGDIKWPERYFDYDFNLQRPPGAPEPKPFFTVLARDPDGEPIGLLLYRVEEKWVNWQPQSTASVALMIAPGPDAFALLWRFLVSLDHINVVRSELRPVDEIVSWLLADGRRAQQSGRNDYFWARPLDVPNYLQARSYPTSGRVVIQVDDSTGLAGGRFALEATPDGASCVPTSRAPDLTLSTGGLGSISLGGVHPRALLDSGRIDEHTPGAVDRTGLLFSWPVAPWCSVPF